MMNNSPLRLSQPLNKENVKTPNTPYGNCGRNADGSPFKPKSLAFTSAKKGKSSRARCPEDDARQGRGSSSVANLSQTLGGLKLQTEAKILKCAKITPRVLSVEGNIGSGKSTLVEHLRQHFESNPRICFLQEPIDEWNTITDENGVTMLEKYYGNPKKYAFSFQMMAYISRLSLLKKAIRGDYDIIVTERCIHTDAQIFAKMLYDDKKIEEVEYAIYKRWWDEFLDEIPEVSLVYVRTDPKISKARVGIRAREGEDIPLSYLESCHNYHEAWMNSQSLDVPKLVLDANVDIKKNPRHLKEWINKIDIFMKTVAAGASQE